MQAQPTAAEILVPDWSAPAPARAAFTLRRGGVSLAPFDSLNIGAHVGDSPDAVRANRAIVRESLQWQTEPAWLDQVHGTAVVDLDAAFDAPFDAARPAASGTSTSRLRGDAAVSRTPGHVCAIQVADCLPVLFAATDGSAVGAAHAGWRGLAGGVLERTIEALAIRPRDLIAWLGPAIGQTNFEVGNEVRERFVAHEAAAAAAFLPNDRGRWQCDLYALARQRLETLGVRSIFGGGWCTYSDSARFFSYRRDRQCGRMAALIWLETR